MKIFNVSVVSFSSLKIRKLKMDCSIKVQVINAKSKEAAIAMVTDALPGLYPADPETGKLPYSSIAIDAVEIDKGYLQDVVNGKAKYEGKTFGAWLSTTQAKLSRED